MAFRPNAGKTAMRLWVEFWGSAYDQCGNRLSVYRVIDRRQSDRAADPAVLHQTQN